MIWKSDEICVGSGGGVCSSRSGPAQASRRKDFSVNVVEASGNIGAALRRARKACGLTLDASAGQAGVTKGYLSKVETGQAIPSMGVMIRLADIFGIPISDILLPEGQRQPISVVRANERIPAKRGSEAGYLFEIASKGKLHPRAEVFFLTVPVLDRADPPKAKHSGEEVILVLEGRVRFIYAGAEFILQVGDCIQFDAKIEHCAIAEGGSKAQLFVVTIPDRIER